jgi:putative ABC transport system substrate-binding protein
MITRRRIILAFGAGACCVPLPTLGQQQRIYRIGYLANRLDPAAPTPTYKAFVEGLQSHGWIEGKNIQLLIKSSGDRPQEFDRLARELVQERVDVIVSGSLAATRAAKATTTTIPIIFGSAENPVERGLVKSLPRPGGNVTGFATIVRQLGPKRLECLKLVSPGAKRFARMYRGGPDAPSQDAIITEDDAAARQLNVALEHIPVTSLKDIEQAFDRTRRIDGFNVKSDGWLARNAGFIAELALERRIPVIGGDDRFPKAGALMSYGENYASLYREAAEMVDKILKNEAKPADMPVRQAQPELVINHETAKRLGITIPVSLRQLERTK